MSCPRCGELCRCASDREATNRSRLQPRFEPDKPSPAILMDPEADDGSEQRFAASLEENPDPRRRRRFIVGAEDEVATTRAEDVLEKPAAAPLMTSAGNRIRLAEPDEISEPADASPPISGENAGSPKETLADPDSGNESAWRDEVAARVNRYRSRRRSREPRYPSLQLSFESTPPWASGEAVEARPAAVQDRHPVSAAATARAIQPAESAPPETAKIIPFPRSTSAPPARLEELAEPVLDRPRILEVPETAPPPPALGGILIEPEEQPQDDKRPGIDMPLQSAPLGRRVLSAFADGILVLAASAGFAYVFFRMTSFVPPALQAVGLLAAAAGLFWSAYQYLLLVYSGTTPGLWMARLRLSRFDGAPAKRRLRRWRVLASFLSGLSLGLGYAWCFLDEDALCWHDRITRTYLAPKK